MNQTNDFSARSFLGHLRSRRKGSKEEEVGGGGWEREGGDCRRKQIKLLNLVREVRLAKHGEGRCAREQRSVILGVSACLLVLPI